MQESLTCSLCSKTWKRNKTRGRKPTICPKCIKLSTPPSVLKTKSVSSPKLSPQIQKPIEIKSSSEITQNQVYQVLYPKDPSHKELLESTKNGSTWRCTACGNIIKLAVAVSAIPTHKCSPSSSKINLYERIG